MKNKSCDIDMDNGVKISISDVENKIIPKESYKNINEDLRKKCTEWCCTKYKINDKIYFTFSIRHHDSPKIMYVNSQGDQIIYLIDEKYEKYVVDRTYWYATD